MTGCHRGGALGPGERFAFRPGRSHGHDYRLGCKRARGRHNSNVGQDAVVCVADLSRVDEIDAGVYASSKAALGGVSREIALNLANDGDWANTLYSGLVHAHPR